MNANTQCPFSNNGLVNWAYQTCHWFQDIPVKGSLNFFREQMSLQDGTLGLRCAPIEYACINR